MGSLQLHTGPRGSYYYFKNDILDLLSTGQKESFLAILPVNRAVRYLKKELVSIIKNQALLDPPIYTFGSLTQRLYQLFPQRKKIISKPMRLLLVNHLLRSAQPGLNYFQSQWNLGNGLVQKVEGMVEEFYQFGFRPEDFSEPPPTAEIKYQDFGYLITELFQIYADRLIDEAALLPEVVNRIDARILQEFAPDLKKIYLSGFGLYSPPMLKFLTIAKEYYDVEIKIEYDSNNQHLFRHTADAFDALSKLATKISDYSQGSDNLHLSLFNPSTSASKNHKFSTDILIQDGHNRLDEIRLIVSRIKEMYHKNGQPLSRIGITFPNIEKYIPLIRKVFKESGIPYNLSTGFSMAESPLIQSLVQVLRVAASGFKSEEVYKLALSPFLKTNMSAEAEIIRRYSKKFRLNYISDQWLSSIENYTTGNQGQFNDLTVFKELSAERITEILGNIHTLISTIKPLCKSLPVEEFRSIYIQVLKQLGLINWYDIGEGFLSVDDKEKEFRAFNRFIKLLDQIIWILNYAYNTAKIPIQDFYDFLTLAFENATYNLREWSDYGVQIMPRLEILSLSIDTLFIGGLIEGEFPRHFIRDIFFNDDERAMMGLNASEDLLSQDRFIFYQLLTSGAKNIILSYPEFDADTKLLHSTFLTSLEESVPDIKKVTQKVKYSYLSVDTFLESLGASLRNGLTDEDKNKYVYWQTDGKKPITALWQNGIEDWYNKKNYGIITTFEGNLTGSAAISGILAESLTQRSFSITALESYAFCPMQYFLQRILDLKAEEEFDATISSLERGNAIHHILYLFYSRLSADQRKKPWESGKLLEQTAMEVFQTFPYSDILWTIEKEKYFGNTDQPGLWDTFLAVEKEIIETSGFLPSLFETGFGYLSADTSRYKNPPVIIKNKQKSIKIYGKIDRIDISADGKFSVIDYKTGSGATGINPTQILSGESMQLPIYIAAAEQILAKHAKKYSAASGIYYLVQDGLNCRQKPVFVDQQVIDRIKGSKDAVLPNPKYAIGEELITLSDLINISLDHAKHYAQQITDGNFRHTFNPKNEKCVSYCAFRKICRKDVSKLETLAAQV